MRAFLVALLLVTIGVAGCADDDPGPEPTPTGTGDPTGGGTGTGGTGTGPSDPTTAAIEEFAADATSGDAPLTVTFTLAASSTDDDATWTIDFGDGEETSGAMAELPVDVEHTYQAGGAFEAYASIQHGENASVESDIVRITVSVPQGEPPQLTFEYGESLGCAGDFLRDAGLNCISASGPDESGVDGFWEPLDERYWGRAVTSTVDTQLGDSDCDFLDADLVVLGDANNSAGPCQGTVPPGTAWIFLYPYAEPSAGMTLTFS